MPEPGPGPGADGRDGLRVPRPAGGLCLATYVFGKHTRYIPYYVYSALSAYPDYFVKVYHEGGLPERVVECAELIARKVSPRFELCRWDEPLHAPAGLSLRVDARTIRRYLLPRTELDRFDYVYIGDCDMFFLPETPSLLEFHLRHMRQLGLPFSNCVRKDATGAYTRRLTGLHFLKVREYFDALGPEIERLRGDPDYLASYLDALRWDEEFLYRLVESSFDLGPLEAGDCPRPWHGLHLGAARKRRPDRETERSFAENSSLSVPVCRGLVEERLRDPVLRSILRLSPDQSFLNYLLFLGVRSGSAAVWSLSARHRARAVLKDLKRALWR